MPKQSQNLIAQTLQRASARGCRSHWRLARSLAQTLRPHHINGWLSPFLPGNDPGDDDHNKGGVDLDKENSTAALPPLRRLLWLIAVRERFRAGFHSHHVLLLNAAIWTTTKQCRLQNRSKIRNRRAPIPKPIGSSVKKGAINRSVSAFPLGRSGVVRENTAAASPPPGSRGFSGHRISPPES